MQLEDRGSDDILDELNIEKEPKDVTDMQKSKYKELIDVVKS